MDVYHALEAELNLSDSSRGLEPKESGIPRHSDSQLQIYDIRGGTSLSTWRARDLPQTSPGRPAMVTIFGITYGYQTESCHAAATCSETAGRRMLEVLLHREGDKQGSIRNYTLALDHSVPHRSTVPQIKPTPPTLAGLVLRPAYVHRPRESSGRKAVPCATARRVGLTAGGCMLEEVATSSLPQRGLVRPKRQLQAPNPTEDTAGLRCLRNAPTAVRRTSMFRYGSLSRSLQRTSRASMHRILEFFVELSTLLYRRSKW